MHKINYKNVNAGAFAGTAQNPPPGDFFKNAKIPLQPLSGVSGV